jgi:hypothetical protein
MWPPNTKFPRSASAVLNSHCCNLLDMSRSSSRGRFARSTCMTEYVKYFSTFVFANKSWFCFVLSFKFHFLMVWYDAAKINHTRKAANCWHVWAGPPLGVVLRGLPARGRSITFPVWRKSCISRTMMEWLTLKCALPTVVQGFGANEPLHFRTTTLWAQLLLGMGV